MSTTGAAYVETDRLVPPGRATTSAVAVARNDSLDGLRAVAVLMVMGVHVGFPALEFGWLGVDIFFVLSGFLITTLLAEEFAKRGRISLPRFWGRRFLRLMPIYWLYAGGLTVAMLLGPADQLHTHGGWTPTRYIVSLWAYFVNLAPKGGIWAHQSLCVHLWSLAVEEQYYFVWPLLCALCLRFRRAWLLGLALVVLVLVCRHASQNKVTLHTRGIGIVIGSTVALYLRNRPPSPLRWFASVPMRWTVMGLAVAVLAVIVALGLAHRLDEDQVHGYLLPWLCGLFALIIAMLWYGPMDGLARRLSIGPLAYLGRISYGLYLFHMLAQYLTWGVLLRDIETWNRIPKYGLRCVTYFGITLALASASYQVIERPFLRLKGRLR
jgi:peptidoglycan/LPS O-acetylase OafA/YrhL